MEVSSFIISDLQLFVRRRDLPGVNGGAVRLQFLRTVFKILVRQIGFRLFLLVAARRVILAIFVPTATSSTMVICTIGFPAMLIRLFGFSSLEYWCWYSCRCGMIALMVACVHVALALRLKFKKRENHYWYLQVYSLIYVSLFFGWFQEDTRLCHGRRRLWRSRRLACFLDFIL
jgi:hypothetical protein